MPAVLQSANGHLNQTSVAWIGAARSVFRTKPGGAKVSEIAPPGSALAFGARSMISNRQIWLALVIAFAAVNTNAQSKPRGSTAVQVGVDYDARQFLSNTERNAFRKIYPRFDEPRTEKSWEWKDVDPLGIFSPEENRKRRRELFLFEYSSEARPTEASPTEAQEALAPVLRQQLGDAMILMDRKTIKIVVPYTARYEGKIPLRNLLEKTTRLGLKWAELGGANLYIYNGPALMSRYKSGYVSLADRNIDQPTKRH